MCRIKVKKEKVCCLNEKIQEIADNMKKCAVFSKKTYNLKEILGIHTQYLTNKKWKKYKI